MGTRYINPGRLEDRVDTVTDIIGDSAQQLVREVFAPRISKLSRNALNVMPFPFEFFQRVRTGRRCSCFGVEDDAAAQCHVCFPPGTLVRTESGYRPIESVEAGERVLSGDGTFQEVLQVMQMPFAGELVSLQSSVSSNRILATPEHPFLAMGGYHKTALACGPKCNVSIDRGYATGSARKLPSGRWWAQVQVNGSRGKGRKTIGTFDTEQEARDHIRAYVEANPKHALCWKEARDLHANSWLVAKWPSVVEDIETIKVPKEFLGAVSPPVPRRGPTAFDVNEEFMWVLGLFLAEGSCAKRTICFSLHQKEVAFQERVRSFFESHGYTVSLSTREDNLGVAVLVHSSTLAEWFSAWLGRGCQNKHVPEELMRLPNHKLWALLRGVYDGDGDKSCHEITQTSELLALQMTEILHRSGYQPLLRHYQATQLTPKGNKRRLAYCVSWEEDTNVKSNRKARWNFESEVLARVNEASTKAYAGSVYNLEVAGDHTYVVNGVVVHNCMGSGIVGGYVKRGTRLWMLDVTANNVRAVNVAPDYRRLTRPVGFSLVDTAVYGYLETEMEIGQNLGIVDALDVYATKNPTSFVEPYIKSSSDEDWVPLDAKSLQVRLGFRRLGLRIVFRRQGPHEPIPSLAGIRISYAVLPNSTVRVDIPRITESRTLEDFGIYESFSSQTFFLDGEVKNITTEDFFYSVIDGTRWKCIEVKSNVIAGTNTSWDLVCRLLQTYEPMQGVPVGIVTLPSMRPPATNISEFAAAGGQEAKKEAASVLLPATMNATEATPWQQVPAPYKPVVNGPISNEALQVEIDSKK